MRKIYFISGEHSGDFIGSKIIQSIDKIGSNNLYRGIGGSLMQEQGLDKLFDISEINLMGFAEIVPHIFRIKKLIRKTFEDILRFQPDVVVTIDAPGFTFRVAKLLKNNILFKGKLVHVCAPSVWAYRESRAKKYAQIYDHLLAFFPFEPHYFTQHGLDTTCIGHPVIEQDFFQDKTCARREFENDKSSILIGVTMGSRTGEINCHSESFLEGINIIKQKYHNVKALFIAANKAQAGLIANMLDKSGAAFEYQVSTKRLKAFAASDVMIAKSGTNTLEIAASKTPMIVCYKISKITYMIIKYMIKIPYVTICNILAGEKIIPELLQNDCSGENIARNLSEILDNKDAGPKQVKECLKTLKQIGFGSKISPSTKAAQIILSI